MDTEVHCGHRLILDWLFLGQFVVSGYQYQFFSTMTLLASRTGVFSVRALCSARETLPVAGVPAGVVGITSWCSLKHVFFKK